MAFQSKMAAPMDVSGDEMPKMNENLNGKRAPKGILSMFSQLSKTEDKTRENAVIRIIAQLEKSKGDATSTEFDYCIQRLIRGLQSPNNASRLGYFVALVEILRKFKDRVNLTKVAELISELSKSQQGKQENNPLIAMVFAYGALVRSEVIYVIPSYLQLVCKELLKLFSQKDFLQEICAVFLVEVFKNVETSLFEKYAWPALQSHFKSGWATCTPDTLWMILVLSQTQKQAVNDTFLGKHWKGKQLLAKNHFQKIVEICLSSSKGHSHVHPVCKYVLNLLSNTKQFPEFWKTFVEAVMVKQQKEKLCLLFELLKDSFEHHLTTPMLVHELFLPSIVQLFATNLTHKEMLLHGAAVQLAKSIMDAAILAKDGDMQFEILKCLLTHPGTIMFDQVTRTATVSSIIPHLKPEAATMLFSFLRSTFKGLPRQTNGEAKHGEKAIDSEAHRGAALRMITQLFGRSGTCQNEAQKDMLQFFCFHTLFNQHSQSDEIPQCSDEPFTVSKQLHDISRECFYKLLSIPLRRVGTDSGSTLLQQNCEILSDLLRYVHLILQNPEVATPCTPLSDEADSAFSEILKKTEMLDKKTNTEGQSSKSQAFQVLFLNLGLQLFMDEKHTLSILEDLHVCYDKALHNKTTKNKKGEEAEPHWVEVIVDLLLSLLSKNSLVLRVVANNVFLLLVPYFTPSALQQILDVIEPSREEDDDSVLENESLSDVSVDSKSSSESESEEDGDDCENTELNESTLALKKSVKAALGDAADDSENEDEEETYMDDAAMERVDESLAQVFRSIRKKKSGLSVEDEALLHFRNRCLEVLGLIVSSRPSIPFILPALFTTISALEFGYTGKHQQPLSVSATKCLKRFFDIKKFLSEDSADADVDFKDVLSQLVSRFQAVANQSLFALIADACTFVFRCALHFDARETKQKKDNSCTASCISIYKDSLRHYIRKNDCHIPERLFLNIITSHLLQGWEFADVLLECAFDQTIRLFKRTRALSLMTTLTSHHAHVQQFVSKKQWSTFSLTCIQEISKSLDEMLSTELKMNCISKMLLLAYNIVCINKETIKQVDEYETLLSRIALLKDKGLSKESIKNITKITAMLTITSNSSEKRSCSSPDKSPKKKKVSNK